MLVNNRQHLYIILKSVQYTGDCLNSYKKVSLRRTVVRNRFELVCNKFVDF